MSRMTSVVSCLPKRHWNESGCCFCKQKVLQSIGENRFIKLTLLTGSVIELNSFIAESIIDEILHSVI